MRSRVLIFALIVLCIALPASIGVYRKTNPYPSQRAANSLSPIVNSAVMDQFLTAGSKSVVLNKFSAYYARQGLSGVYKIVTEASKPINSDDEYGEGGVVSTQNGFFLILEPSESPKKTAGEGNITLLIDVRNYGDIISTKVTINGAVQTS